MSELKILIEASARHVHVTREHLEILYGAGAALTKKRDLSQPGEFLSGEKLRLEGPRGAIDRVSILGPERASTQAEISMTDARALGVTPILRESGDVAGSAPVRLVGPAGSVELAEGCIIAKRHVHLTPDIAERHGLKNKQLISVRIGGERGATLHEVVCRVSEKFAPAAHIDFDEANAVMLSGEVYGTVMV
ncbi:MAG: phosphate propanoyltransferase [Oscillospiraceae bacterium]|nr:phosphate propanoyltransferase [Oscillospiraceae bacterium]